MQGVHRQCRQWFSPHKVVLLTQFGTHENGWNIYLHKGGAFHNYNNVFIIIIMSIFIIFKGIKVSYLLYTPDTVAVDVVG